MNKDLIWILIIGFVFGFIAKETFNDKSWLFIFQAMQGVGAIAIPFVFFYLGQKDQKRREFQEQNRRDKEDIENLLMNIISEYPYKERVAFTADDYHHILKDIYQRFDLAIHYLRFSGGYNKYLYLDKYISQCCMFLMRIDFYRGNRYIYELLYGYCIVYIKRDMQLYINQGYLNTDWEAQFIRYDIKISQALKRNTN